MVQEPAVDLGLLIIEALRSHSDTTRLVGFLWMSDQPNAETSTWQHTALTTDRHPCAPPPPGGIRPHNPSKRTDTVPRLRPLSHPDRLTYIKIVGILMGNTERRIHCDSSSFRLQYFLLVKTRLSVLPTLIKHFNPLKTKRICFI
jgi:hypothetical protein